MNIILKLVLVSQIFPEIDNHGTKRWYLNDKLHRIGKPAIEFNDGTKCWYQNGKHHRIDGPAFEYTDGHKEYWINGVQVIK